MNQDELRRFFDENLKKMSRNHFLTKHSLQEKDVNDWMIFLCEGDSSYIPNCIKSNFYNANCLALTETIADIAHNLCDSIVKNFIRYCISCRNNNAIVFLAKNDFKLSMSLIIDSIKNENRNPHQEIPLLFGPRFFLTKGGDEVLSYISKNGLHDKFSFFCDNSLDFLVKDSPTALLAAINNKHQVCRDDQWAWNPHSGQFSNDFSGIDQIIDPKFIMKCYLDKSIDPQLKSLSESVINKYKNSSKFFSSIIYSFDDFDKYKEVYELLRSVITSGSIFTLDEFKFNWPAEYRQNTYFKFISSFTKEELIQCLRNGAKIKKVETKNIFSFMKIIKFKVDHTDLNIVFEEWLKSTRKPLSDLAHKNLQGASSEKKAILLNDQLDSKKADERAKAVASLVKSGDPELRTRLDGMLAKEKSDEVRLELYKALDPLWMSEGRNFSRASMAERLAQVSKRLAKPVAPWLDEAALPPLPLKDGAAMSAEEVRHLCSSLALMPELEVHPEARPWFDLIGDDRKASGPFALALLKSYLSSKVEPKFRFALGLAGRLGDETILPILNAQVDAWAKGSRGKMAEYAAAAIALQGSEMALMITDDIAQRYRSKNANIGSAAREAMQEVAQARGLSIDQLGDAIIPWLGFVPGQPRLIPTPKGDCEVRIGSDGKLSYLIDGKAKSSAPTGISADTKAELKTLASQLRAVLKAQKARHNRMLVQERRWPLADWQKLYLAHPALRPFLVHQIWGLWNAQNQLIASFRQEEDGSFVQADESAFALPAEGSVGLIHPLHLDGDAHHEWKAHLAAAAIKPLVPQLERPLRLVSESEKGLTEGDWVRGVQLGGMTFKGRADRLGWIRGSVVDAGGIESYRKPFPEAGIEALLTDLDGMYIGIDPESQITLGGVCFVKLGSVQFGSYTYDTPGKGDSRLLSFSQVPPIVFSEAVSDALLIAGKTVEEEEED